jgi:choline dehydrogenase-like flavoprotein
MKPPREADVLIIGAGAAGAAAAWRLARAGLRVVCLERGDWVEHASSPSRAEDWERRRLGPWHPNPNIRRGPADSPIDDRDCPTRPQMFNGVGGSTVMWSCHAPRMHPSDFSMRRLDGVGRDWPIGYDDLASYYEINERMMGVCGLAGDPAMPARAARSAPPAPIGAMERCVVAAFERLGWHWWPGDIAHNTGGHPQFGTCTHCGPCELGCPARAKGSADIAYWPQAIAAGAQLVTRTRALEITHDDAPRATGAVCRDAAGTRHRVRAPVVILAANGIFTPHLLLLSRSGRFPRGIGNDADRVGRTFMLHPMARVAGRFEARVNGHRGIAAGAIISREFYETDARRGFVRGCKLQILRSHGPALAALGSTFGRLPWGQAHHRRFAEIFDRTLAVSICADDLPEDVNRVTLSDRLTDDDGLPAPRLVYRVGENSRRILDFGIARGRELLLEAGARELVETPLVAEAGFHLMGTAAMGEDGDGSVVDRWSECHALPGLFVADGSAFATAAAVNPTNTLQALALRCADRIIATRAMRR